MPGDDRMSFANILTCGTLQDDTNLSLPLRRGARPQLSSGRVYSSQLDPWNYPSAERLGSTYSINSDISQQSTSSMESTQPAPLHNPGLERSDSTGSYNSVPVSPVTPVDSSDAPRPADSYIGGTSRLDELAAGAALTSMRNQQPCLNVSLAPTAAPSSYTLVPRSPIHNAPRRSQSPRSALAPRDVNGNRMYPCPLASGYRCDQHFSTSGHARRHSRIHTGERGAECPECGQKFSRQDNMQQHRRTHRNGRDGRRAATNSTAGALSTRPTVRSESSSTAETTTV